MKNKEEKKRKQDNCQPISIKLVLKVTVGILGYMIWGIGFLVTIAGVYIVWGIIKQVLSCLFSLLILIGFITLIFSFIIK